MTDKQNLTGVEVYFRLLGYVRPYTVIFIISIIGFLLFAATQPAMAQLAEYLVDAINEKDADARYWIPALLIGIYVVRGIGSFLGNYYLAKVSQSIVHNIRCELFDHQMKLPTQYFDSENSGHLISRITYNVTQVTGAATTALKVIIREGFTVLGLLAYLFYTNWKLTLIFLAIAPLIGIIVSYASKRFKKISKKIQVAMGDITHVTSESINGFREVRTYGGEEYEINRFTRASKNNMRQGLKMVITSAINTPILQMIIAFALGLLMFFALSPEMMNGISPGEFIAYLTAAGLMPKPIRQLSEVNSTIQKGIAAAESIFELLDYVPESDLGGIIKKDVKGRIEIKELSFTYPNTNKKALNDISFTIEPGEMVALVGHSGSGKSTLASLIPRFYDNQKGAILLDGEPVNNYQLSNLRKHIALVSQQVTLFNDTVARNIAYGSMGDKGPVEIAAAAKSAHATEFINLLPEGMDTLVGEDGVLLSGGQRQRLAIARAILKDAPILILDEATSALDTESERHIQDALEAVMQGRTTLVIAHRLSTIEKADKIIVMENGQVVEMGKHQELVEQGGPYAKLYNMQFSESA